MAIVAAVIVATEVATVGIEAIEAVTVEIAATVNVEALVQVRRSEWVDHPEAWADFRVEWVGLPAEWGDFPVEWVGLPAEWGAFRAE